MGIVQSAPTLQRSDLERERTEEQAQSGEFLSLTVGSSPAGRG